MAIPDVQIEKNGADEFPPQRRRQLRSLFRREGFVKIPDIVPGDVRESIQEEALGLLDDNDERRDLRLATTGNTKRAMSVVRSEVVAEAPLISTLYRSPALGAILGGIAGEALLPCPAKDEEFLITRQERVADTHGWHWGDFSFALIWLVVAPPVEHGGMLH